MTRKEELRAWRRWQRLPQPERLQRTEGWLRASYPTPYPVVVRYNQVIADDLLGETYRRERKLFIRVSRSCTRREAIETLLHEWAHAVTWPNDRLMRCGKDPDHSDEWGLAWTRIYRNFFDGAAWTALLDS